VTSIEWCACSRIEQCPTISKTRAEFGFSYSFVVVVWSGGRVGRSEGSLFVFCWQGGEGGGREDVLVRGEVLCFLLVLILVLHSTQENR
jgi:hypothetical protein